MGTLQRWTLRLLWALVSIPFVAIVGDLAVSAFRDDPWFLVEFGQQLLGVQGFWVACVLSFGLGAGGLLLKAAQHIDKTRYHSLTERMNDFATDVFTHELTGERVSLLLGRAEDIERRMKAVGLPGLEPQDRWNAPTLVLKFGMMCNRVRGALEDGDSKTARELMENLNTISIEVNEQPSVQSQNEIRKQIKECRTMIANWGDNASHRNQRREMESWPEFLALKRYMSDGFMETFESDPAAIILPVRPDRPALMWMLENELNRLEKEWAL